MSVIKSKRGLSNMEFYHNAVNLRKYITLLLLRDFGMKTKIRDLKYICNKSHMSDDDKEMFEFLVEKYSLQKYGIDVFPEWLIEHFRNEIITLVSSLINEITHANTIYVTNKYEYHIRRIKQNNCIIICEQLIQQFQFMIDVFNVDANKYMYIVNMISREIGLLKRWRTSDKKRFESQYGKDIFEIDVNELFVLNEEFDISRNKNNSKTNNTYNTEKVVTKYITDKKVA